MDGPLKVARTFIENEPEQFGIYAPRVPGGRFNGEQLALCEKEANAQLFAAAPELLKAALAAIIALDMYDKFGDDIDARHAAEEHAFCLLTSATIKAIGLAGETV